jgi:hypothetical protein
MVDQQQQQYLVQRLLQQAHNGGLSTSATANNGQQSQHHRGLLTLQDFNPTTDFTLLNGFASASFSPMSPVHSGHGFAQNGTGGPLFQLTATPFPATALAGLHNGYQ